MILNKWNDNWKSWKGGDSFSLVWNVPENAVDVTLPHDAMRLEKPYAESPNQGNTGFVDGGVYYYVKKFKYENEWEGKEVIVRFDGIYEKASIYINEQLAGSCNNGYSSFYVNITGFLERDRENEIRVIARAGAMPNSRWYSGAGIYRDVYIMTGDKLHLDTDGLRIKTESADSDSASLLIDTTVKNITSDKRKGIAEISIYDSEERLVAKDSYPVNLMPFEKRNIRRRLTVKNPGLWSDESPNLYKSVCRIEAAGSVIDETEEEFGIRTLSLDNEKGLRVNGKSVKLRGACVHHDSGILGAETYEEIHLRQIRILKEAGFNAVRMSHQSAAPALLKVCDRLGIYVMDEFSDMWTRSKSDYDYAMNFPTEWEKDLALMINKDYNHPSVIIYSIGNEIPEIGTDAGSELACRMSEFVRENDDTRYITAGINGVFAAGDKVGEIVHDISDKMQADGEIEGNVNDFMSIMDSHMDDIVVHDRISERLDNACTALDIAGYNYMTARYEKDKKENPERIIVGSETYPPEIARNWELVEKLPTVIGDFTWTGWDYIGEAGVGVPAYKFGEGGFGAQFPCRLAYCGDIDITGFRRPASYFREIVFGLRKEPYIAVQNPLHYGENIIKTPWVISDAVSGWNWNVDEGSSCIIEVYSAGDEVELLQDGKSLGRKKSGKNVGYITEFESLYRKGRLEAISYERGEEIGRFTLSSAEEECHIQTRTEKCGDIFVVDIEIADSEGRVNIARSENLRVKVISDAEITAFGSADPKCVELYKNDSARTFNGRAQLMLKGRKGGIIEISSDKGLTEKVILVD